MIYKYIICLLLPVFLLLSCFQQLVISEEFLVTKEPLPDWVNNPGNDEFVGISHEFPDEVDARTDAINNARIQIVESMGAIVESNILEKIIEATGKSDIVETDAFTESNLKVISKNILHVQPSKTFTQKFKKRTEKGIEYYYKCYALVPFSKEKHERFISELISTTEELASEEFFAGLNHIKNGELQSGFERFDNIQLSVDKLNEITSIRLEDLKSLTKLLREISDIKSQCINSISISGKIPEQRIEIGYGLSKPLELSINYELKGKRIPLKFIPVVFRFKNGSGFLTDSTSTDAEGKAYCHVKMIRSGGKLIIISAQVKSMYSSINSITYNFILKPDNSYIVKIVETSNGKRQNHSLVEENILSILTEKDYSIVDFKLSSEEIQTILDNEEFDYSDLQNRSGANYAIIGIVEAFPISRVMDKFWMGRARAFIKVIKLNTGEVLNTVQFSKKDGGNTEDHACRRAVKKLAQEIRKEIEEW